MSTRFQQLIDSDDSDDWGEVPDSCYNRIDGHWYEITYGRAPYTYHAADCATCAPINDTLAGRNTQ